LVIFALPEKRSLETPVHQITHLYGNSVRFRVCGIWIQNDKILLVDQQVYGADRSFWSPPGGGIEFGESAQDALKREFKEETELTAEIGDLLFVNEFIQPPLHAIELFFGIKSLAGEMATGFDPEFSPEQQLIREVRFLSLEELKAFPQLAHGLFSRINSLQDLYQIKGYLSDGNKI
jgi:8-oxo-dGTP diphosphatase